MTAPPSRSDVSSLTPPLRPLRLGLAVVWAALLFGGFLLGNTEVSDAYRMPLWTRLGSSAVLVLAAQWAYVTVSGTRAAAYALLIAVGMALGFLGDLSNAGLLPLGEPVMGAIAAFGLGHVAYIAACITIVLRGRLNDRRVFIASLAAWELVGVVGWAAVVASAGDLAAVHWAALPYTLLLAGTAGVTSALALQDRRLALLGVGGALFLISDLVLAYRLFHDEFYLGGDVVWLLYGPAQMFIVYSVGSAVHVLVRPPAVATREA
ncbi:MAG: lysoplasmalogenase family protein [Pirellulales bacterium]